MIHKIKCYYFDKKARGEEPFIQEVTGFLDGNKLDIRETDAPAGLSIFTHLTFGIDPIFKTYEEAAEYGELIFASQVAMVGARKRCFEKEISARKTGIIRNIQNQINSGKMKR